jgi:hypothetical protein
MKIKIKDREKLTSLYSNKLVHIVDPKSKYQFGATEMINIVCDLLEGNPQLVDSDEVDHLKETIISLQAQLDRCIDKTMSI